MVNIALNPELLQEIRRQIGTGGAAPLPIEPVTEVCGGQINRNFVVRQGQRKLFVKLNDATRLEMFAAEREALIELQRQKRLHVPSPLAFGVSGDSAFLVMDYMEFGDRGDAAALGRGVAALHEITADAHGWRRDNTIGTTPQHNPTSTDWPRFWAEHRLG
ncbi:MAG: phosphotransferase, partial [Xanthomonadales bacterium]|nr:phosphotransferase [Xanthomonadales bacterium]